LATPLLRGDDGFEPISWEQAFELCATKLEVVKEESGPAAIFHYRSGGSLGALKPLNDWFFEVFGPCAMKRGDICGGAGEAAQEADFGVSESSDLFDLLNAKTIVLWGKNPKISSVHTLPVLREASKNGARIFLIDPVQHGSDRWADTFLQPRAGTDEFLARALARRLFDLHLVHEDAAQWCDSWAEHHSLIHSRTAEEWLAPTGLSMDALDDLAQGFGAGPTSIQVGWGMQRRTNGGAIVRAIDALAAISGNVGIPGGGVSFYYRRLGAFDHSFIRGLDVAPRTISEPLFAKELAEASDPPVRMTWIDNGNPVAMLPDSEATAQALRACEFTVVADAFMTDTARCADLVLPTTTMLEEEDFVGAFGHHWVAHVQPAVAPQGEAKSDLAIFAELAQRLGFGDQFHGDAAAWKKTLLNSGEADDPFSDELRSGAVRNPGAANTLFEGRKFPTESGRVQLYCQAPSEPCEDLEFPFNLLSLSVALGQSSQTPPSWQDSLLEARVHPDSAAEFADGEDAFLESRHGRLPVRVLHDRKVHPRSILVPKGGWHRKNRSANAIIPAVATDLGEGAAYLNAAVRLVAARR